MKKERKSSTIFKSNGKNMFKNKKEFEIEKEESGKKCKIVNHGLKLKIRSEMIEMKKEKELLIPTINNGNKKSNNERLLNNSKTEQVQEEEVETEIEPEESNFIFNSVQILQTFPSQRIDFQIFFKIFTSLIFRREVCNSAHYYLISYIFIIYFILGLLYYIILLIEIP